MSTTPANLSKIRKYEIKRLALFDHLKKSNMDTMHLLPAKFDSNIYLHRQSVSDKLDKLIQFRLSIEVNNCKPHDVLYCDILLKQEHEKFIKLGNLISITENSAFRLGGFVLPDPVCRPS